MVIHYQGIGVSHVSSHETRWTTGGRWGMVVSPSSPAWRAFPIPACTCGHAGRPHGSPAHTRHTEMRPRAAAGTAGPRDSSDTAPSAFITWDPEDFPMG